jgi:hypothetical protein
MKDPPYDYEIVNSIVLGNNALVEGNEINFLGDAPAITDQNIIGANAAAFDTSGYGETSSTQTRKPSSP